MATPLDGGLIGRRRNNNVEEESWFHVEPDDVMTASGSQSIYQAARAGGIISL